VFAAYVYFWFASTFEERKFARSPVAKEYEEYKRRTGRFFPRIRQT
jgi:protein-S-isoprenylcysteine O-methyltransferase Ste14